MAQYFGTDGIRGIVNKEINFDLAFRCGNSLAQLKNKPLVLVGKDTRLSKDLLFSAFVSGVMCGGGNIIDAGVIPTAGVAFLTQKYNADFGIMISASHNSAEYNGIKFFDKNGNKLLEECEEKMESLFTNIKMVSHQNIGKILITINSEKYENHLIDCCKIKYSGLKIVLDCANGASEKIAPKVFKKLDANVLALACESDGLKINDKCGSLHPENLIKSVLENEANVGFAFDGDSDRILAVDEKGNIVDGDQIVFILANYLKAQKDLNKNCVVGTSHTNIGIQKTLDNNGIKLLRSDVGDKYVLELMQKEGLNLGGEQSGHVILTDYATTGDGVLAAIKLTEILVLTGKKLSELVCDSLFEQANISIIVKDKIRIMNSELLANAIDNERVKLGKEGRIMVRASGTEPKIRVMAETQSKERSEEIALKITNFIKELNI